MISNRMRSIHSYKNLLVVNSDCMCVCMFNIVSFILSMVSVIILILSLFFIYESLGDIGYYYYCIQNLGLIQLIFM